MFRQTRFIIGSSPHIFLCVALQRLHSAFSCGVAKDCTAVREVGKVTGIDTNKVSVIVGWSVALFAAASARAFP